MGEKRKRKRMTRRNRWQDAGQRGEDSESMQATHKLNYLTDTCRGEKFPESRVQWGRMNRQRH